MKITKLSKNIIYRTKQEKIIAFFMKNKTNWYTIQEVDKLCFGSSLSRRCLSNLLFELPLLEEKRSVIINQRNYKLLSYKYSDKILKLTTNNQQLITNN